MFELWRVYDKSALSEWFENIWVVLRGIFAENENNVKLQNNNWIFRMSLKQKDQWKKNQRMLQLTIYN